MINEIAEAHTARMPGIMGYIKARNETMKQAMIQIVSKTVTL